MYLEAQRSARQPGPFDWTVHWGFQDNLTQPSAVSASSKLAPHGHRWPPTTPGATSCSLHTQGSTLKSEKHLTQKRSVKLSSHLIGLNGVTCPSLSQTLWPWKCPALIGLGLYPPTSYSKGLDFPDWARLMEPTLGCWVSSSRGLAAIL